MENNVQALILVDLQNDYLPGGKNELENSPEAGRKAAQLLAQFRIDKLPPGSYSTSFHPSRSDFFYSRHAWRRDS